MIEKIWENWSSWSTLETHATGKKKKAGLFGLSAKATFQIIQVQVILLPAILFLLPKSALGGPHTAQQLSLRVRLDGVK